MANIKAKQAAKKVAKMRNEIGKNKPKPKDTSGVVKRIEGNIAYVRFQGSEIDTPVNISIACSVGDNVRVRVGDDHKAWTLGNASAPPTDDRVANVARRAATDAVDTAAKAEEKAVEAEYNSESALSSAESAVAYSTEAKQIAGKTNQYFWHIESVDPGSEDETGAHITEVPQEEWEDPNSEHYHSGGNLLARSNGIAIRKGLNEIAYYSDTARIGTSTGNNVFVDGDAVYLRTGNNINAKFTSNESTIYSGSGTQYYTKVSPKSFGVYSKQNLSGYSVLAEDSPFETGVIEEGYTSWEEDMIAGSETGYDDQGDPTHVCSAGEPYSITIMIGGAVEPSSLVGAIYFQLPYHYSLFPGDDNTNFNLTYKFVYGWTFDEPIIRRTNITISTESSPVNVFGLKLLYRGGRAYPYSVIGHYPEISKKYVFAIGNGTITKPSNVFAITQDGYIRADNEAEQVELNTDMFQLYNSNEPITIKRFGNVCHLHGKVKPASTITGSTDLIIICTLPEKYRPDCSIVHLCQGSGNAKWLCSIYQSGYVTFSRYHNTASAANTYINCTTSQWLPFDITYII